VAGPLDLHVLQAATGERNMVGHREACSGSNKEGNATILPCGHSVIGPEGLIAWHLEGICGFTQPLFHIRLLHALSIIAWPANPGFLQAYNIHMGFQPHSY
jgi:hypothetical protein